MRKPLVKKAAGGGGGGGGGDAAKAKHSPDALVLSPKMRLVSRRLKELEDEKAKLEQMINDLSLQKERVKQREQRAAALTAQAAAAAGGGAPLTALSKEPPTNKQRQQQSKPVIPDDHDDDENDGQQQSEVSSLRSVGVSRMGEDNSSDESYRQPDPRRSFDSDDVSIMTEDVYHYDARGRRVTDDDYFMEDTETIAACYQQINGRSANSDDRSTVHKDQKKKKKSSRSSQEISQARVVIEWKRGRSYKPEANLAFDHSELYNYHPTDLSLMVNDDKSFFDDLSFSSGDDSQLVAAITDMPMEIDLASNGSDESVNSGLHTECSVSVAAAPYQQEKSHLKSSKQQQQSHDKSGLVGLQHLNPQNPTQFLYQRNAHSLDRSDDSHDRNPLIATSDGVDMNESNRSTTKARRRRRSDNHDVGSPPPLTTDMSLVDEQQNDKNDRSKQGDNIHDAPPLEISLSQLSLNSMDSLGSEMGGASLAQEQKATPATSTTKTNRAANGKAKTVALDSNTKQNGNTHSPTQAGNKKSKKKKNKAKGSPQPPQPAKESLGPSDDMMLADRHTEKEENELKTGALVPSVREKEEAKKGATINNDCPKGDAKGKAVTSMPQRQQNPSSKQHVTNKPNGRPRESLPKNEPQSNGKAPPPLPS